MPRTCPSSKTALLDLPLEVLADVCLQLDLRDLVCLAETCKRVRHGDGGLETVELPIKSPAVMALRALAFPRPELVPSTRPIGCSESWVAYLARCARQRSCREAPPIAAGEAHCLCVKAAGRLLAFGKGAAVGHGHVRKKYFDPTPVAALAHVRVRSVAAFYHHSLALTWDGRVYSWGANHAGQLGHGDTLDRLLPARVEGLEDVRGFALGWSHSLAATHSGDVFLWGQLINHYDAKKELRPTIVEGFGGVRVRRVFAGGSVNFALGKDGELFSWGKGRAECLGHGDTEDQPLPKRVEALRDVRVSTVSVGTWHALALAEDGVVFAWGMNLDGTTLGNPHVERELLPKPVEALRGVRVGSVLAASRSSYAVADTGQLWAWGDDTNQAPQLGHGERMKFPLPMPVESLRGVKLDAVAAGFYHRLARADDGSVYTWGSAHASKMGMLGLGPSMKDATEAVRTPRRVSFGL
jgi:alpha-tubulin suppressor-like RCC1 family protein